MSIILIFFILMAVINLPSRFKKKEYGLCLLLVGLALASVGGIYVEIDSLRSSGIPWF